MADKPVRSRHRSIKVGRVMSCAGNKTVVVKVTRRVQHPLYQRYVNRSKKFHAHDEQNQCRVGDRVRIVGNPAPEPPEALAAPAGALPSASAGNLSG